MALKKNKVKTHSKSRIALPKRPVRPESSPACWLWTSKGVPARILFVDETRDKHYAVFFVDDEWRVGEGQKKKRFSLLAPQSLRGSMQITLDEFAEERSLRRCGRKTWDSIRESLKTGGQT